MRTIDVNTSDETVDGTPPGQTFQPLRYTTTRRDEIRVGIWTLLLTPLGSYRLIESQGLDIESILDPSASDAERAALVGEIVLGFPGVTAILEGPTVVIQNGILASISVRAETVDGPIEISASP